VIVSILLVIGAVLSFLLLLISLLDLIFPGVIRGDDDSNNPVVILVGLLEVGLGLGTVLVYIATIVLFLMWLYRSYENLAAFGVAKRDLQYSSGWAVGSFFVPFVSLVVPYRAVKELWRKSVPHSTSMFSELSPPAFFPLWWAFWLLSNFANQIYFRLTMRGELGSQVEAILGILTGILDIFAAILAMTVVWEIYKQQTESSKLITRQEMNAQPPPPPEFAQLTPSREFER